MKLFLFFINFLFVLYYAYVNFVFYRLNQNLCSCNKLEKFKNTWNFNLVRLLSPVLLLSSLYFLFKTATKQYGGSKLYYNTLFIISLGYGITFLNDYAILNLFHIMEKQSCPCQEEHRRRLNTLTYVKLVINIIFYVQIMIRLDKKKFNNLLKKIKKANK